MREERSNCQAVYLPALNQLIIVLHTPRNVVNIGGVVRVMKNMGIRHLRMVSPVSFHPSDVTGIAHRGEDIIAQAQTYTDINAALADVHYVVGTTSRARSGHPSSTDIRRISRDIVHRTAEGMVALVFGPEDNGLDNLILDRCHTIVTLPTDPTYPSLNLAQAVLLFTYEIRAASAEHYPTAPRLPASSPPPATVESQETFFETAEQALRAIEFFKSDNATQTMRVLRTLVHRAEANERELALLTAIARETLHFLHRSNVQNTSESGEMSDSPPDTSDTDSY